MKKSLLATTLTLALIIGVLASAFAFQVSAATNTDYSDDFSASLSTSDWVISGTTAPAVTSGKLLFTEDASGVLLKSQQYTGKYTVSFDLLLTSGNFHVFLGNDGNSSVPLYWQNSNSVADFWFGSGSLNVSDHTGAGSTVQVKGGSGTDVGDSDSNTAWYRYDFTDKTINVKMVVDHGTVTVYYKQSSDPASDLDTARSAFTFANVTDTDGYLGFAAHGASNINIDNVAVTPEKVVVLPSEFSDNFDRASLGDNYVNNAGDKITVANNKLTFVNPDDCAGVLINSAKFTDFTLSCDLVFQEGSGSMAILYGLQGNSTIPLYWQNGQGGRFTLATGNANLADLSTGTQLKTVPSSGTDTGTSTTEVNAFPRYDFSQINEGECINFKLVVNGDKAYYYYKKSSEPDYALFASRCQWASAVDPSGFVAFVAQSNKTLQLAIDNLSITSKVDPVINATVNMATITSTDSNFAADLAKGTITVTKDSGTPIKASDFLSKLSLQSGVTAAVLAADGTPVTDMNTAVTNGMTAALYNNNVLFQKYLISVTEVENTTATSGSSTQATVSTDTGTAASAGQTSPKTGDQLPVMMIIPALFVLGLLTMVYKKKQHQN